MNNLYVWKNLIPAKVFAVVTMVSLILSAFPASFLAANIAEAATPVVLFSEDFEGDLSQWAEVGPNWSIIGDGGGSDGSKIRVTGTDGSTGSLKAVKFSTVGYDNIQISYDYRGNLNGPLTPPDGDYVFATYDAGGGMISVNVLNSGNAGDDTWKTLGPSTISADDAAEVELLFNGAFTAVSDQLNIDNILVTGEPIETEVAPEHKIDICHWSEGDQEFELLNVAKSSIGTAHGSAGSNDGDIIPAFDNYGGQNMGSDYDGWTGAEVLENDCVVPDPEPDAAGDLRICKILVDENFEAIDGGHLDSDFSVRVQGPEGFDETVVFDTALDLNTKLLTDTGVDPDAECVTFEDVATGKYTYEAEEITGDGEWQTPLYHDFFTKVPTTQADFGELTVDGSDTDNDDTDGVINLGKDKTRTLAIWNAEVPPAPICEIGENLLDNGSFEEPVVVSNKDWIYTAITDWMITALDDDAAQDGELHRGWSGNQAADGEQYAELDSRESVKMAQSVATVEGATYELKWAFAPRHNIAADENQLSVQIDGNEVATEGPATLPAGLASEDWTRSSYTFQATSDETEIAFADAGVKSDSLGTFLDDAALCFVRDPEPEPEIPEVCSLEGEVVDFSDPVFENDGDPVNPNRRDVTALETAAPYSNWGGKEPSWSVTDFFSLGIEGYLVYEFTDKIALNQPGPDIAIWEITGGNSGQSDEKAKVSVSADGINFVYLETITGDGAVDIAPAGLPYVKFVKLEDDSAGVQGGNGDGFDVDAITIIEGSCDDFVTVSTTKIECDFEDELPNWGGGSDNITANTAANWLSDNDDTTCREVEWEFEWAPKSTANPGNDFVGAAGGDWTTFTGSTNVPASAIEGDNAFWMREVLPAGYIPFGGSNKTADESAELYCHKDVLNYDNYDRVDNPKAGEEYHCVAWNVPEEVITYAPYCGDGEINQLWEQCELGDDGCTDHCLLDNQCSMEQLVKITLDDTTEISPSFDGSIHLDFAGNQIPSGTWFNYGETVGIDNFVNIANSVEGLAVKRNNTDGTLDLAFRGDNARTNLDIVSGTIMTKGIEFGSVDRTPNPNYKLEDGSGNSFDDVFDKNTEDTMITFDLRADTGNDGVTVEVNQGEKYNCEDCRATVEARVILNDSDTDGEGDLSDEIILGDASYSTVEFGEWFPVSEAANPGDSAVMINDPNTVTNFDAPGDKPGLFVSRENGTVKVALYGEHNPGGNTNNEWLDARIEIRDAEITNYMPLAGQFKLENHPENDGVASNDGFDEASADDTGVDFKLWVDTASDGFKFDITNIAFCDDDTEDMYLIDGKKYEGFYARPLDDQVAVQAFTTITPSLVTVPGLPDWTIELYDGEGNFITSTTTDETGHYYFWVPEGEYEVREVVKPGWMQVGVDDSGDYVDVYPDDKPYSCEFDLPKDQKQENSVAIFYEDEEYNYSDYRCDFYNARTVQQLTRIYGYKFETPSDLVPFSQGLGGWTIELRDAEDNVVDTTVTESDGSYEFFVPAGSYYEVHEVLQSGWSQSYVYEGEVQKLPQGDDLAHCGFDTQGGDVFYGGEEQFSLQEISPSIPEQYRCEFYNEQDEVITTTNGGGGGGSTGTLVERATPQVAGAATMCPFLTDYMQIGWENDPVEVTKLQLFLNIFKDMFGGTDNPITGVFDATTDANVKALQEAYRSEVLDPWFELGIVPHNRPTGFVYKTTLWKINDIVCPDFAVLPDFEGEDLTTNVNADID